MSYDNLSLGMTGASRFSGQRGRTADGTSRSGIRYPSPFFDIAHTYLPPSMKAMMRWCRYYYLTNPLINTVIHKMSEYPITEIVVDVEDDKIREKWETILGQHLRYRAFQIETGLDTYTYGICAVTIHFPFTKFLECQSCKKRHKARKTFYKWRNYEYVFTCPSCGHTGPATIVDQYEKDFRRIRLMRWNPEYINVDPGFGGAEPIYTFEVPLQLKNDLVMGKKLVLDTIPDVFVEAMKRGKNLRFTDDNLFVLKRPIIAQKDNGWGMPLIMPVMKDAFYLQVLRKAQEAIASEHIVPLRVLFPQPGSGTSDPYSTVPLEAWKSRIEGEIAKWKYDNNYLPILPLPIGNETIGGDGKALGLYQEMNIWNEHIIMGMGVPIEFVKGGMQYSGSNVSMRMLENMFIGYRLDHENMLNNFVIRRIANFMGWPVVKAHMKRFKMADDLQRSSFYFQLNQAQKISDRTLLQEVDMSPDVEIERRKKEQDRLFEEMRKMQVQQANIQGEVMLISSRYQAEAQKMMMANMPQGPGGPGGDAAGADAQGGAGGMDAAGGVQTGQDGEMVPGPQVDPGMPDGSTVSMENAQQSPQSGVPLEAQSPLTMGQKGGGANLLYLARRAASELGKGDEASKNMALAKMKMTSPQLYSLVLQTLQRQQGSQANPLSPTQSPLPSVRPSRRASSAGA